jgi:gamma-glutamylputrescine oxidase
MIRDTVPSVNNFYEATAVRNCYAPLHDDSNVDICVIGGGIAGCSTALHLSQRGYRVALLEADWIGHGASGRSGGQLLPGYSCGQQVLQQQLGNASAHALWDISVEAVQLAVSLIKQYNIECDLKFGHVHAAIKPRHRTELLQHQQQLQRDYGYEHLRMIEGNDLRPIINSERYIAGLYDSAAAHLHPLNYTLGLARAAAQSGAVIHEHTKVISIEHRERSVCITTAKGRISAKHVILCCNVDNLALSKQSARIMPVATYMIATEQLCSVAPHNNQRTLSPRGRETERGGQLENHSEIFNPLPSPLSSRERESEREGSKVLHTDTIMNAQLAVSDCNFIVDYFRMADSRLLFGGGVSYSGHANSFSMQRIRHRMLQVFPQLKDVNVEYAWYGLIDISMNRAPDFGRINSNVYYLQGFSGHGLALATMAGKLIADSIAMQNERFDLFSKIAHRPFPGGGLRTPLLILAMLWYRLRDAM